MNEQPARSSVRLTPLHVPKASEVLAASLRDKIVAGDFAEGSALPPERELVAQTRMSRTTVREALRVLEAQGFVEIRTGRSGGTFAKRPGGESLASSVSLVIRGRQIRMADLIETREAIEPSCARLAARYRTDQDLETIEAANRAIAASNETGSLEDFLQSNVDWHIAVATASHNELLTGFMAALSHAIYESTDNKGYIDDTVRQTAVRAHQTIIDAIRAKDEEAAVRRMIRHVHTYSQSVAEFENRKSIGVAKEA
ncbi:FadR family transcriptional regulator [Arthrobacter sp. I2-34]|uniref:FadR family transcriptional regulator n=1 Tax=Arthrobacter hankyongi TaxID=2904801 RepID=A0ABS9L3H5_9MICC|nr:FadR/GntR family transcriptional regulator [Arthrobacter hankyongi]MCG2621204.1 FadR family transcriptional regulator [Arthrobacter hankyongi]